MRTGPPLRFSMPLGFKKAHRVDRARVMRSFTDFSEALLQELEIQRKKQNSLPSWNLWESPSHFTDELMKIQKD